MTENSTLLYTTPCTEEAAVDFITIAMGKCDKLKDLSDIDNLHVILKSLSTSYFDLREYRLKICETLIRKNYLQITETILENLMKLGYFSDDSVWFSTFFAYNALWNYCDFSKTLATGILNTGIPKIITDNIVSKSLRNSLADTNCYYLLKASISIVHNIARFPGNSGVFNCKEVKDMLLDFIKRDSSDFLGLISMMALSVLVEESELHLLEEGSNTINCLIEHINDAHKSADKRVNGFMVWELVNCIKCISANDTMARTILRSGGLDSLLIILKDPTNDDDVEKSLGAIWNLCFSNEVTDDSKAVDNIKISIKPYENSTTPEIKRNHDGIVWLLANKSQFIEKTSSAPVCQEPREEISTDSKYDIFISYDDADTSMVWNIMKELTKSNVSVWNDSDQLETSSIGMIADGIEKSRVFIVAVSNAYRTSAHCRSEVEYALSLNKPIIPVMLEKHYTPSSWLGFIVGSKKSHAFCEQRFFYDSMRELFDHIIYTMRSVSDRDLDRKGHTPVEEWSEIDVKKWAQNSDLLKLKDLDGPLLKSMIDLASEVPEFLYQVIRVDYGMSLQDILKMRIAFKKLS